MNESKHRGKSRRAFLSDSKYLLMAGLAGATIGQACTAASPQDDGSTGALGNGMSNLSDKFADNYWNRDAFARLQGDLDFGKQKFGWYKGQVLGVRKDEKVRPLCGFEGFSFSRLIDNGDGVYKKVLREVGFYTDLRTGEVLEEFVNPYTQEKVKVVHIANDPFNFKIGPFFPKPPSYGGLNKEKTPDIPFRLPFQEVGNGLVVLNSGIHLCYPSALQPDKWPRESPGKLNRVSEMFTYVIKKEELADDSITGLEYAGNWSRITPWLPWMLMDQAPGHINYSCVMGSFKNMDDALSPQVKAYAQKHYPSYFEAPTEWVEPSLSSLERYALEQKPAPRKG